MAEMKLRLYARDVQESEAAEARRGYSGYKAVTTAKPACHEALLSLELGCS